MTNQLTPGYSVESFGSTDTPVFFTDANLITARRTAMNYVETLLKQLWRQEDNSVNIRVSLVEAYSADSGQPARVVAQIYERTLADSTSPVTPEQQAAGQKALHELDAEYTYYLSHQQHMGMGFFRITMHKEGDRAQLNAVSVLSDAFGYAFLLEGSVNPNHAKFSEPEAYTISTFYSMRSLMLTTIQTN